VERPPENRKAASTAAYSQKCLLQRKKFEEKFGGARRNRTADLLNAIQALSQLSYGPTLAAVFGITAEGMPPKQRRLYSRV
jgi:hypothetical protein